jgi:hypothetical protein
MARLPAGTWDRAELQEWVIGFVSEMVRQPQRHREAIVETSRKNQK